MESLREERPPAAPGTAPGEAVPEGSASGNAGASGSTHGRQARQRGEAALGWLDEHEQAWPAELAVLASIALYVILPARLLVGPRFLVPTLELLLLFVIRISKVHEDQPRGTRRQTVRRAIRHAREPRSRRAACVALLVCVSASNAATLVLLTDSLLQPSGVDGRQLLLGALAVWATNVLSFALWFWEFDRGGPGRRHRVSAPDAIKDFSFPQEEGARPTEWSGPVFVDYLYLAYTNATAFSPTDAMPITPKAKMAMMFQSMISLLTVLLVTARAVNILS